VPHCGGPHAGPHLRQRPTGDTYGVDRIIMRWQPRLPMPGCFSFSFSGADLGQPSDDYYEVMNMGWLD